MLKDIILMLVFVGIIFLMLSVAVHLVFLVPFVPSKRRVIERMIRLAKLKKNETVFDLGCGDGRLLTAAEKAARVRAVGFELAPLIMFFAWLRKLLSRSRMQLKFQSFFSAPLKQADVIFCYLLPDVMPRLAQKMKKECKKGTRIISNTFHIPGLKPAKILARDPKLHLPTIYLYKM